MKKRGRLYVFEGPDGVGKTTLSMWFAEHLTSKGEKVFWTSFPGKVEGTLGSLVYKLHHNSSKFGIEQIQPLSLQLLHLAAHIDAIQTRFREQIESGVSIVLDRYWWSTWVYGCLAKVDPKALDSMIEMEKVVWGTIKPDRLFLLSRSDKSATREHLRLARLYVKLARKESSSHAIIRIPNNGTLLTSRELILSLTK